MARRRTYSSYNDGCAAAHALDLVGERWTLVVVRELFLGPKRFSDLQRDVVGIGPTVLTQRLTDLEARGIVRRRRLAPPANVDVYELTSWGLGLERVNAALSAWAVASPELPVHADMSPDTLVLAMRAHARPTAGREVNVALHLSDSRIDLAEAVSYRARLSSQDTRVERVDDVQDVVASVWASTSDWKSAIIGAVPLKDLPGVRIDGNRAAARRLIQATALG